MAELSAKKRYALALDVVESADRLRSLLRGMLSNATALREVTEILDDYDAKRAKVKR